MWITKWVLVVAVGFALLGLYFLFRAFNTPGGGALVFLVFSAVAFLGILIPSVFYGLWMIFFVKKKDTRRKVPAPSRFVLTEEGDIVEIMEDEKRKRGEL